MNNYQEIISPLQMLIGRKVFLHNPDLQTSFVYDDLQIDSSSNADKLILYDGSYVDSKLHIPLKDFCGVNLTKNEELEIESLFAHYYVTCLDQKPILPTCDRCKNILTHLSHPWYINQTAGYGEINQA
jgi:hypothetical protein